jgi:hypothetical protein
MFMLLQKLLAPRQDSVQFFICPRLFLPPSVWLRKLLIKQELVQRLVPHPDSTDEPIAVFIPGDRFAKDLLAFGKFVRHNLFHCLASGGRFLRCVDSQQSTTLVDGNLPAQVDLHRKGIAVQNRKGEEGEVVLWEHGGNSAGCSYSMPPTRHSKKYLLFSSTCVNLAL